MLIQLHTDVTLSHSEDLTGHVTARVEHALAHYASHISRVEVHLADDNGGKHGANDKRCTIEARVEGLKPLAASHHADSVHDAVEGAAKKLAHAVDHAIGKQRDRH